MMTLSETRELVLIALKKPDWNQFANIESNVGLLKAERAGNRNRHKTDGRTYLVSGEYSIIHEIIWSFIIQGVLMPGSNDSNPNLPHLRLTEYGKKVVAEGELVPHDPDGFLQRFREIVPNADQVLVEYLTEALQCYIHGLYRASAVMLGGASERGMLLLMDSIGDSFKRKETGSRYKAALEKAPTIYRKFEVFKKRLDSIKGKLPSDLRDNLDTQLAGIFDLIRNTRNDAGHPARVVLIEQDLIYSHIRLFVPYCGKIYSLMEWFSAHKA